MNHFFFLFYVPTSVIYEENQTKKSSILGMKYAWSINVKIWYFRPLEAPNREKSLENVAQRPILHRYDFSNEVYMLLVKNAE